MSFSHGMITVALLVTPMATDAPDGSEKDDALEALPDSAWSSSISELDRNITDLDRNITELEQETTEGEETVVTLSSDILFEFGESEISSNAENKIAELVEDVPEGATVEVHGHTDSIGPEDFNQELSEDRANTVADVIADARPDLTLDVQGFGENEPVEANEVGGEDNPEGRALNRRVEIRYVD